MEKKESLEEIGQKIKAHVSSLFFSRDSIPGETALNLFEGLIDYATQNDGTPIYITKLYQSLVAHIIENPITLIRFIDALGICSDDMNLKADPLFYWIRKIVADVYADPEASKKIRDWANGEHMLDNSYEVAAMESLWDNAILQPEDFFDLPDDLEKRQLVLQERYKFRRQLKGQQSFNLGKIDEGDC